MKATVKSLSIGALGGAAFFAAGLPLAWMMGSMCLITVLSLRGTVLSVNPLLRKIMTAVLGVMLGSSFSPDTLSNLQQWSSGLLLLLISLVLSMGCAYFFLRRIGKFDQITSYFCAAPGGFNVMYEVGEAKGGDGRKIALVHATRVLLLVMVVPLVFRFSIPPNGAATAIPLLGNVEDLGDYAWLLVAAISGYFLGKKVKLPAYHLMGPLIVAAIFELSGFIAVKPPMVLIYAAQLVIGTAIGVRFFGTSYRDVRHVMIMSCASTALMMAIATVLSFQAAPSSGISIPGLILALSPGGLVEMSLVALAMGIDVAFVSIMHVLRIIIIIALIPAAYPLFDKYWLRRRRT